MVFLVLYSVCVIPLSGIWLLLMVLWVLVCYIFQQDLVHLKNRLLGSMSKNSIEAKEFGCFLNSQQVGGGVWFATSC